MVAKFWDEKNGGFYQTQNSESGIPKMKQLYDGATPSGNSVALLDLLRLSRLTGEPKYEKIAIQMTEIFAEEVEGAPEAYTFFLLGLDFIVGPSYSVTIVGDLNEKETTEMINEMKNHYLPTTIVQLKLPNNAGLGYQQIDGKATAYVCQNQTCLPPTNNVTLMFEDLGVKEETK